MKSKAATTQKLLRNQILIMFNEYKGSQLKYLFLNVYETLLCFRIGLVFLPTVLICNAMSLGVVYCHHARWWSDEALSSERHEISTAVSGEENERTSLHSILDLERYCKISPHPSKSSPALLSC